ncbi:hypothetical protein V8C86DRAFT_3097510 [Haematococcus lacustris]
MYDVNGDGFVGGTDLRRQTLLKSNLGLRELDLSNTQLGNTAALCLVLPPRSVYSPALARIPGLGTRVTPVLQVCDLTGSSVDKSWLKLVANIITGRSKSGGHK